MKKYRITSVSEYLKVLEELRIEKYIFRGQNEPYYGIRANGFRPYKGGWNTDKIFDIRKIANSFYNQVITKLTDEEKRYFLAFCQHYGIPTNLVDFSYSPLIALFFACYGKSSYHFTLQELIGDKSLEDIKKDVSLQSILIHNLVNTLEKNTISNFAQVYLIDKKWLLDITEIVGKLNGRSLFEGIYSDSSIRFEMVHKFMDFFKRIKIKDVMSCLKNIIQCYKDNNIDLYGTVINEEFCNEEIFVIQEKLNQTNSNNTVLKLYSYVFNIMEEKDENILYDGDIFKNPSEYTETYQLSALTYVLLLVNLIDILKYGHNVELNFNIYFTYQPANLFDRIDVQKGLFIYQPYIYLTEDVYDYSVLNVQNINPDICIEIDNYSTVLDELDYLGINVGKVYGDLDNIAKSVVSSFERS